jgi:phosphocarrier protein HPr
MSEPRTPSLKETFVIQNRLGLHARAAALFVQAVAGLDADVFVSKDDETVDGKSIMGLILLGAGVGSSINVEARVRAERPTTLDRTLGLSLARPTSGRVSLAIAT